MNVIQDTWKGLLERRLWPVAVVLILVAAALPFVLAKSPEKIAPAAVPVLSANDNPSTTVVSQVRNDERLNHPDVLGTPKDPFAPRVGVTVPVTASVPAASALSTSGTTAGTTGTPAIGVTTPATPSVTPAPAPASTPTPKQPRPPAADDSSGVANGAAKPNSTTGAAGGVKLSLRWAAAGPKVPHQQTVAPMTALSEGTHVAAVYLNVSLDGKGAVFYVDSSASVTGAGTCSPGPNNCETLTLREGQAEDVSLAAGGVVTKYHLYLVHILNRSTKSARVARTAASTSGSSLQPLVVAPFATP